MQVFPAGRGIAWLTGALVLLRRQPARLMLLGLVLQFILGFSQIGLLALLLIVAIPVFTAGMMQAMSMVDQGARPPLSTLFAAFLSGGRLPRLLVLGTIMLTAGILGVMVVLSGSLAEFDPAVAARLEAGDVSALESIDPDVIQRLMFAMLTGLIVSGCIAYLAVPLVWFRDLPLGLAIRRGLFGMIRNWRPFLVLGLLLGVLVIPAAIMTAALLAATASGSAVSPLFTLVMLLIAVAYQLILFGAQYVSFGEIFGTGRAAREPTERDGQLVA